MGKKPGLASIPDEVCNTALKVVFRGPKGPSALASSPMPQGEKSPDEQVVIRKRPGFRGK